MVSLILLIISFNKEYFRYYLNKSEEKKSNAQNVSFPDNAQNIFHEKMKSSMALNNEQEQNTTNIQNTQTTQNNQTDIMDKTAQIVQVEQTDANIRKLNEKTQLTFFELFKRLWDLDLIVMLVYTVTFTLFPFASINQKFLI